MFDILVIEAVRQEEVDRIGMMENVAHFRFGASIRAIYEENVLAQKFIKLMLTDPTVDYPMGGSLISQIPENFHESLMPEIRAKMALVVSKTERDILKDQIGKNIPNSERLRRAEFINLSWTEFQRVLSMDIRVTAISGDVWFVRLPLAYSG